MPSCALPGDTLKTPFAIEHIDLLGQGVSKIEELPVRSGDWSDEEIAKGRKQLVAAIDAAWIRIVDSGRDQEVLRKYPKNMPGASLSYIVRLADRHGRGGTGELSWLGERFPLAVAPFEVLTLRLSEGAGRWRAEPCNMLEMPLD